MDAKVSRSRWLLLETFNEDGREPSVIAKGRNPVRMVPLGSVMSKSRYAEEMRALILRATSGGEPLRAVSGDGQRKLIAYPLFPVEGRVHGVCAWIGGRAEPPPPRASAAGAWHLDLASGHLSASEELFQLYGVKPADRAGPHRLAEAFERLLPAADEGRALGVLARKRPGDEYQGTWTIRRDDGLLRQVTISCRVVTSSRPGGQAKVVLRGITHDTGPADGTSVAGRPLLDRQILIAEQRPGIHRVIVDLRNLRPLRWVDSPPPGLACAGRGLSVPGGIHPDDMPVVRRIAEKVTAGGRAEDTLRLRDHRGGWMLFGVAASPVLLDQETRAALVALSAQP